MTKVFHDLVLPLLRSVRSTPLQPNVASSLRTARCAMMAAVLTCVRPVRHHSNAWALTALTSTTCTVSHTQSMME